MHYLLIYSEKVYKHIKIDNKKKIAYLTYVIDE